MVQENFAQTNESLERYKERISNFSSEFELGLFLYIAKKNLLWFILFLILAITGAYLYLRYTQEVYEAGGTLQIKNTNNANKVLNVSSFGENPTNEMIEAAELLRSKMFFQRALSRLPLNITYFTEGTFKVNELYVNSPFTVDANIKDNSIIGTPFYIQMITPNKGKITYTLNGKLNTRDFNVNQKIYLKEADFIISVTNYEEIRKQQEALKKTSYYFRLNNLLNLTSEYYPRMEIKVLSEAAKTIKIIFKDNNAQKTADIVNAILNEFKTYDVEKRGESSKKVIEFLNTQIDVVYDELKTSETDIQAYKKEKNLNYNEDVANVTATRLNNMEDQIIKLELEEGVLMQIQKKVIIDKDIDVNHLVSMLAGSEFQGSIAKLISSLQDLIIKKEQALYEATPNNMAIKSIEYQIESQKNLLIESIESVKAKLALQKNNMINKANEFESKFFKKPIEEVEFARLQRLFTINEKFYTLLLEKRAEYSISQAGFVPQHETLETPTVPGAPVSPNRTGTILSFVLVAILFGLGLILFKYLVYNDINSLNEISKQTNSSVSVLGIVPKYSKEIPVSQLLVDKNPKSLIAEAFRSIRTNLQFISNRPGSKLMAVTSTISGEGKTFVAINLAGIIAFSGKKVIILDLDMRKPKIHIGFNAPNTKGMSTILINKDSIDDSIQHSSQENLHFVTAGPIPPNPSELIIGSKMDEIIEYLKTKYDMVIIDTPPVGLVTDGIAIIQKADYPVYIFRAEYSKRNFIQNVDRLQNENDIKKLSVILNGVDIERKTYGYNYGYGYGYGYGAGYGYGYYEEQARNKKKRRA